jgi:signal transduction histidine kinase
MPVAAFPDTRAELAVPIEVRNRLYGVLDIQVNVAAYFLDQEIRAIEILANQIAWVIYSGQQNEHVGWLNRFIETIADPIFTQTHLDETLQEIADSALEELNADLVFLFSTDPAAKEGISDPIYSGNLLHPELLRASPRAPDNVVFRLISSSERIYINEDLERINLALDPLFRPSPTHVFAGRLTFIQREEIKSNVIIRLLNGSGQCVGVLFLNFRKPRSFSEWDKKRYYSFAHLAALAIQKMQSQQQVIQREKNELANLIHDALIGNVTGLFKILNSFDIPGQGPIAKSLRGDVDLAMKVAARLNNDIRWISKLLKDEYSDEPMLEIDGLFMLFRQVFSVKVDPKWSGDIHTLPPELNRELFLIIKEALINAVRHGSAKEIGVAVAVKGHYLNATITDDGVGFDLKQVKRENGLLSMRYRVEQMGGEFMLTSGLGKGTKISVKVPIPKPKRISDERKS